MDKDAFLAIQNASIEHAENELDLGFAVIPVKDF